MQSLVVVPPDVASLVVVSLGHRVGLGGAHRAASGPADTVPNRLSGQTRSTTVPTTASRGTVAGTGAVTVTASAVEEPTTAA